MNKTIIKWRKSYNMTGKSNMILYILVYLCVYIYICINKYKLTKSWNFPHLQTIKKFYKLPNFWIFNSKYSHIRTINNQPMYSPKLHPIPQLINHFNDGKPFYNCLVHLLLLHVILSCYWRKFKCYSKAMVPNSLPA